MTKLQVAGNRSPAAGVNKVYLQPDWSEPDHINHICHVISNGDLIGVSQLIHFDTVL